jgi:hypothetical protein
VRARFIRAQKKAELRVRRFHDLRHTFGTLAIRRFDLVSVKEMMGHAQLSTTERYLHSKPRPTDAAKLTAIFDETDADHEGPLAAWSTAQFTRHRRRDVNPSGLWAPRRPEDQRVSATSRFCP